jgi:hypothetical protein
MREYKSAIHLISFDVPYPANYGGVIDIFYKLKALSLSGVDVILHCYHYGRSSHELLERYAAEVHYYKRRIFKNPIYNSKPYIVASRNGNDLLDRLLQDDYPILFEGLHTTFHLDHPDLAKRKKFVRTHNIEHHYYKHLEKVERNLFKKYFFKVESERLKRHQEILKHATAIFAISEADTAYLSKRFDRVIHVPPFHGNEMVDIQTGLGEYVLYHGNLAVGENNEAALHLIHHVFCHLECDAIIAGNGASSELISAVEMYPNVYLEEEVTTDEITDLITNAQVNVLHTKQSTGIKLKLINALYKGRHCVVNDKMVVGTGLEGACLIAGNSEGFVSLIQDCLRKEFKGSSSREEILYPFSNQANVLKIMEEAGVPVLQEEA